MSQADEVHLNPSLLIQFLSSLWIKPSLRKRLLEKSVRTAAAGSRMASDLSTWHRPPARRAARTTSQSEISFKNEDCAVGGTLLNL